MFIVHEATQGAGGETSHAVARNIGLKPSHYVRRIIAELWLAGLLLKAERKLPNGKIAHVWSVNYDGIDANYPDWKECIMNEYQYWPLRLL